MNKTTKLILPLIVFLLFFHAGFCFGEQILILGNHKKPPKNYLENDKPKGILIEIMNYVDQKLSLSFEYKLSPWKRVYLDAVNGKGGIIGLSMNRERLKIFDYSDVMYYDDLLLVMKKGKEFPYKRVQDLRGKKVGCLRGASYGDAFEKAKSNFFEIDEDGDGKQRLLKLLGNRIDVAIIGPGRAVFESIIK